MTSTHAYIDATTYSTAGKTMMVKREHHVDHWNSDTLAYYLDNDYPGYDLAIMFYAQWDQYSHALAPYWARIAEIMNAGQSSSKLIMAFFDCELNMAHRTMCETLNVNAYPTMMFIGSGPMYDTDPFTGLLFGKDKSAGLMGHAPVPNTVKFQGNWQVTDSVLDWIKTMQALSRYHVWATEGFGQRLRNFFLPRGKKKDEALPIGVPSQISGGTADSLMGLKGDGLGSGKAAGGMGSDAVVTFLEEQIRSYKNMTDDLMKSAERASTMMESILMAGSNYTDMFALLDERNAWLDADKNTPMDDIQRSCVLEVSLDYCQRVATKVGAKLVDDLESSGKSVDEILQDAANLETIIITKMSEEEPYCGIIETCIMEDMKDEACRPKQCPFTNELACRYLTTCTHPSIVEEYREALGFAEPASTGASLGL
jgi:hypothetical protein